MHTLIGTDVNQANQLLVRGEVVAIPTETVYGLAANALDANAVAGIFEAKNRPFFDPLIVHVRSVAEISKYVLSIPKWAEILSENLMPGPITLVLKKQHTIPDIVSSGLPTVGIRIPKHPLALELLTQLDFPLAAPSANPFGYISPTSAQHVNDQLSGIIPYILDGGSCDVGLESTIIGEDEDGQPVILRLGGTGVEEIERLIGHCAIRTHSTSNPQNPGSLESHYAPTHPLFFGDYHTVSGYCAEEIGIIAFEKPYPDIPVRQQYILSPSRDMREAAHKIFSAMRSLDQMNVKAIFAESFPEAGLGRAINDRLRRASSNS